MRAFGLFIFVGGLLLALSLQARAAGPTFWNEPRPQSAKSLLHPMLANLVTPMVFDESYNFQPGLNLYNEAAQLKDLYGTHGSQLCAPISVTHGMTYLRYAAGFTNLKAVPDVDADGTADSYRDKIRYFFQNCHTDKEGGTGYHETVQCMRDYVQQSGYKPFVYMVGAHATEVPPGVALPVLKHVLNIDDLRYFLSKGIMVVMGIGWNQYNPATHNYTRVGGHIFNVYGYDYSKAWGAEHLTLKVVNSWIDYSARTRETMFDTIEMTKLPADGTTYPVETGYELKGPGFAFTQRAFVEDIFIAVPQKP